MISQAKLFQEALLFYGFCHHIYLPAVRRQCRFEREVLRRIVLFYMNNMALPTLQSVLRIIENSELILILETICDKILSYLKNKDKLIRMLFIE